MFRPLPREVANKLTVLRKIDFQFSTKIAPTISQNANSLKNSRGRFVHQDALIIIIPF